MIPTNTTETRESWVCRACSSTNPGWRLRCEGCGVLVGGSAATWAPPPPAPAPTKRTGRRALAVVGYVVGAAIGFGAAVVGLQAYQSAMDERSVERAEERVDDYIFGQGEKEFFAADSQFRATFPAPPIRSTEPIDVDGFAREMTVFMTNINLEFFLVAAVDLPPGSSFDGDTAAASQDGTIERATMTTWQGYDAVDMLMTDADGMQTRMLVVLTPQRVYLVAVASAGDPTVEFETFKASFEITL